MRTIYLALFICFFINPTKAMSNSSVEMYGNLPYVSDMKISPSGKKVAYLQNNEGEYVLVYKNLNGNSGQKAFGVTEGHIRNFKWLNDERIALTMSMPIYSPADYENFTIWRVKLLDLNTSETIDPFDSISYKLNIGASKIVSMLPKEPLHILMSYYKGNKYTLFKVNILTGNKDKIESNRENMVRIVNSSGETEIYNSYSENDEKYTPKYRENKNLEYKTLMIKTNDKEEIFVHFINGYDKSGKKIYFIKENEHSFKAGYKAEIVNGYIENVKLVIQKDGIDLDYFVEDEFESNLIIGGHFTDDYSFTDYFDNELIIVQADLEATFPNASVLITSSDTNKQKFVIEVSGALYGIEYYLYDTKAASIARLASAYPNHKPKPVSNVRRYDFKASDGKPLRAYLTMPDTKKLPPLIVLPHGGPANRDDLSFDWIRQFYAANGFAVLQVNFRGSSGFGENFQNLGYGEWGGGMQTDLDDGVAKLIDDNLIDKNKICMVGSSYGGYAALIAATTKPEIYKCAVSYAGISHLEDMYLHERKQGNSDENIIEYIGDRFNLQELEKYSPTSLVNKKSSPILLIHGDKDTVVPIRQSKRMYKALKKIDHEHHKFIIIEDADHWFSESNSRLLFLKESHKFIVRYLNI